MVWTNILCEAVCVYDILTKKSQKFVSSDDYDKDFKLKKGAKWTDHKNEHYLSPKHRPSWCIKYNKKRTPQFYCLGPVGGMKCPFSIISNCRKEEYNFMQMGLSILNKENEKKYGKMFEYDNAMPFTKKEIAYHNKVIKEFEKEKSNAIFKRKK